MTETQRADVQKALEDICGARLCEVNAMSSRKEMLRLMDRAVASMRSALAEPTCKQDLQVAEQDAEPFLWYADDTGDTWTHDAVVEGWAPTDLRPLYTTPARRDWIGLTEEEQRLFSSWLDEKPDAEVFAAIEQTLKEKNG